MHLPQAIIDRNPKIKAFIKDNTPYTDMLQQKDSRLKALFKKNPLCKEIYEAENRPKEFYEEVNMMVREIYGVFPDFPFPVLELLDSECAQKIVKKPSELLLRINLNYSKDEIMYVLEKFIDSKVDEYRKNHKVEIKRKQPEKWITYLQIWDLKNGYPPPSGRDLTSKLNAILFEDFENKGRPWTYEEIAKYIYPDTTTPEKLLSAIDKVKKQYRAAYKLIHGKKYNPRKAKLQIEQFRQHNKIVTCDSCPENPHCETLCPPMVEQIAKLEVTLKERLVSTSKSTDIEKLTTNNKKLSSDDQFKCR